MKHVLMCVSFERYQRSKSLSLVDAFLTSQQACIFLWFCKEAIPALLDPEALSKTKIMLTD